MKKLLVALALLSTTAHAGELYSPVGAGYGDDSNFSFGLGLGYQVLDNVAVEAFGGKFGKVSVQRPAQICKEVGGVEVCEPTTFTEYDSINGVALRAKWDILNTSLFPYVTGGAYLESDEAAPTASVGLQYKLLRLEVNRIFDLKSLDTRVDVDTVLLLINLPINK